MNSSFFIYIKPSLIQYLVLRMLALELRNNFLHFLHHLHSIITEAQLIQFIFLTHGIHIGIFTYRSNLDFRMMCRLGHFRIIQ